MGVALRVMEGVRRLARQALDSTVFAVEVPGEKSRCLEEVGRCGGQVNAQKTKEALSRLYRPAGLEEINHPG